MNSIIKSLNMTEGAVLTLEKLQERMEFEAFAAVGGMQKGGDVDVSTTRLTCNVDVGCLVDCSGLCARFELTCSCDGPDGYINCHPYRG